MFEETFVHHHLCDIFRPAFDVRPIRIERTQQAAPLRLNIVEMLELDVMSGKGFVNAEPLQSELVVFAQLRFGLGFRHFRDQSA